MIYNFDGEQGAWGNSHKNYHDISPDLKMFAFILAPNLIKD
jgi:hypothetical protein